LQLLRLINNGDGSTTASWVLTLLSCFAGGVFMGTCFLDIFPHVNQNYDCFRHKMNWKADFPLPEFFICCGFFLVYFLEEASLRVFSRHHHHHSGQTHHVHHGKATPAKELLKPQASGTSSMASPTPGSGSESRASGYMNEAESRANGATSPPETYIAVKTHE